MLVMLQLVHSLVSPHNSKVTHDVALEWSPEREAASPCRDVYATVPSFSKKRGTVASSA